MTHAEILERNMHIARFCTTEPEVLERDLFKAGTLESMHYHDDWNWLMEALKHVTKLGWNWELIDFNGTVKEEDCFSCSIFNLEIGQSLCKIKHNSTDPIKAVFIAVSDFAKLYYNEKGLI